MENDVYPLGAKQNACLFSLILLCRLVELTIQTLIHVSFSVFNLYNLFSKSQLCFHQLILKESKLIKTPEAPGLYITYLFTHPCH